MNTFDIIGVVPPFTGSEFILLAENAHEFREWIRSRGIDTMFTEVGGVPGVKIRGSLAAQCVPGQRIRHRIEVNDRRDGRRIQGVLVQPA